MVWLVLMACGTTPSERDFRDSQTRCTFDDLQGCYELLQSSEPKHFEFGARRSCRRGYRDSCRIWFDRRVGMEGRQLENQAFDAALYGCTRNRDAFLCAELLGFSQRSPRFEAMVEKQRPQAEAVLNEARAHSTTPEAAGAGPSTPASPSR